MTRRGERKSPSDEVKNDIRKNDRRKNDRRKKDITTKTKSEKGTNW